MERTVVAIDCMGGDNAPLEIVKGAAAALSKSDAVEVILLGDEGKIRESLSSCSYDKERLEVVHTTEVIETAEPPVKAINHKKDSSMVRGLSLVKEGKAHAFVSAGNSGALLVGGQAIVGRLPGVKRAPFAAVIPTEKGTSLLVDSGANVDVRPEMLVSFAKMGSAYMRGVMDIKAPTVGIVNIGAEEEKGNALVKETFPLLKAESSINFIGSVEARDIAGGACDVIVCDAFVGNVVLKMYEGVAKAMLSALKKGFKSSFKSKLGAALALPSLKKTLKNYDVTRYGGAPLLGINGLVVKTHGSAKAVEVTNTVLQCVTFRENDVKDLLTEVLKEV